MNQRNTPRNRQSHAKQAQRNPWEPSATATAKRILLVSRNTRLLTTLTRRLGTLGHRVWTVSSEEEGPASWSPGLYDVLVFSAEDAPSLNGMCEVAKKADGKLFLVMLAREPFSAVLGVPDAVITEQEEPAIAEKLLAVVNGSAGEAA